MSLRDGLWRFMLEGEMKLENVAVLKFQVVCFSYFIPTKTMLRKEGNGVILQFDIILTTPSCFPATWKIIHSKSRWSAINGGNK